MNISKTNQHEYTQKHAHIHMIKQIIILMMLRTKIFSTREKRNITGSKK